MPFSFCHLINPFPCPPASEHGIASSITYASLRQAVDTARASGLHVEVNAVVLPGDESSIHPPARLAGHLQRTVQDIRPLRPVRPFPLIADLLESGARSTQCDYLIFSNMDIAVQPDFYPQVNALIETRFPAGVPFAIYRRNLPTHFNRPDQLPDMYREARTAERAYGYDCFVFPRAYVAELDLGHTCIGAAHFDYLLFMALDAISGFKAHRVQDLPLTFHIGNDIAWSAQLDYVEHNLAESLAAIQRMRARYRIPPESVFRNMEIHHFLPNARLDSRLLRRLKRLPLIGAFTLSAKRWLGKSH